MVDTLADMLVDVEALTLFETRSNAAALVETQANTLAQVEVAALGHTPGDANALVYTLNDTLVEVEVVTLGEHTGQCTRTGRHSVLHASRRGGGETCRPRKR